MMDQIREWALLVGDRLRRIQLKKMLRSTGLVVLVATITMWLSFPLDAVLEMALRGVGGASSAVSFTGAGMGLTGPGIEGVRIRNDSVDIQFDHVRMRPTISTLWLNPGVAFSVSRRDGRMSGSVSFIAPHDVAFQVDQLSLSETGIGQDLPFGINLSGTLSGQGDFTWSKTRGEITGSVELAIEPMLLYGNALPLPSTTVTFKAIKFKATADGGNVSIEPLSLDGEEIWGNARGTIELYSTLARSMADLRIRLHFNDAIGRSLGPLLPMAGFHPEREAYVKNFKGPLYKLKGG